MTDRTHPDSGRIITSGDVINDLHEEIAPKFFAYFHQLATHTLRASHGQAPAGAGEEIDKALNVYAQAFAARVNGWTRQNGDDLPGARSALFAAIHAYAQASTRPTTSPQLVCDYCGALTPDPWHSSGMLHGKMSKHIHSCDACASHGQAPAPADSVPAVSDLPPLPAPDLRDVGTKPQEIKEFLKGYATEYARTAIAARAPADSVQEDAARLDFLIDQRAYVVSDPDACHSHWLHWARPDGSTWVQFDEHPTPRAAIDAARKQGGV